MTTPRTLPIGTGATGTRQESDSMGTIEVPAEHYWGAQTQRSLIHFSIGDDHMPLAVYHAYGYVKKAATIVNARSRSTDHRAIDAASLLSASAPAGRHLGMLGGGSHLRKRSRTAHGALRSGLPSHGSCGAYCS
jgi:hypothetical protein